jgi:hypothetical protein
MTGVVASPAAAAEERTMAHAKPAQEASLDGMHGGAATTFTHPRGWFSIDLPAGWTVASQSEGSLAINPGLTRADTLDALIAVTYGELDPGLAGASVTDAFQRIRPMLLRDWQAQGIELVDDGAPPQAVALARAPGLVTQWRGRAGGRDVQAWIGGVVQDGHYLAVLSVIVAGQEARFLPGVKRLFHSLQPRPPRRDPAIERALEGAQFSASDMRPGGSFTTVFEFSAGNRIKKTMIASGRGAVLGGGASEEWGSYEVLGNEVHLSFRDETDALVMTIEQGRIVGLQREGRTYRRR